MKEEEEEVTEYIYSNIKYKRAYQTSAALLISVSG